MSCSQYFLHNLMGMGSLLGTILGTVLNYKRNPYVHPQWCLNKPHTDSSSYRDYYRDPFLHSLFSLGVIWSGCVYGLYGIWGYMLVI